MATLWQFLESGRNEGAVRGVREKEEIETINLYRRRRRYKLINRNVGASVRILKSCDRVEGRPRSYDGETSL